MKLYAIMITILSLFLLLFPLAMSADKSRKTELTTAASSQAQPTTSSETDESEDAETVKVLRTQSGKVIDVALYDYVIGCVAGEMPAYYEKEALKAQAVACYTYARWITANSDGGIRDYDVSDSPDKHQRYLDEQELKEKFGEKYDSYLSRIKECVNEVLGEFLTYDNEPIMACYHALSAGRTQSAKTVWGENIPYLKSVKADGDELSPDFDQTVTFTEKQFKEKAEAAGIKTLADNSKNWFRITDKNKSGYVLKARIGTESFTGAEVRRILSLDSAVFTFTYKNGSFTFKIKGSGHQIGMSQYCADYMARQGKTYKEILLHFYPGTTLTGNTLNK